MFDETFDDIVAGFYRAAAGEQAWSDALRPFKRAVAATAIHLHAVDEREVRVVFSHLASDLPAEAEVDYVCRFHHIDPRARLVMGLQPGQWMHCWEHFDPAFVAADPFYQQFLIPYGGRYVSGVKLLQDEALHVVLGVHRGHGSQPLAGDEIVVCKRLAQHMAQALQLHRRQLQQRSEGRLGMELLARLRAPVLLVDPDRRILACNPAARDLLGRNAAVVENQGRVQGRSALDDRDLLAALGRVTRDGTQPGGPAAIDRVFVRLRGIRAAGDALGVYLVALRPGETLGAFGERTLAMLLLHEAGSRLDLDPFIVAAAFELTPAEARVALAVAGGHATEAIAQRHGASIHTVRSQLATIFQKTGTARQADLVSLLASMPIAAVGPATGHP